ncbi:hypothetical protein [Loigolactobacillus binensis]|uniref:Tetratricopeptide repeat protein n=1 Tax=Loigolactobacillus binensis TaxID=2559922 RepID=A0ABW3E9G8_9LACO|nr:hypothetical protein [Loigolactobacillus binensis]
MGEQIPFPNNFRHLVQLGQAAIAQKKWSVAIAHLQAAYALQQTFAVNIVLVTALLADEQYQQAASLAQEKAEDYLASGTNCPLYLQALLRTHNFIGARKVCQLQPTELPAAFWQQQLQAVEQAEDLYRQQAQQQIQELQKGLYQLSALPLYAQTDLAKRAQHLPQTEFIQASRRVLTDLYVHPLVRANFLDELRQLGCPTTVDYLWLDERLHAVVPADLAAITETASVRTLRSQLLTHLAADPVRSQNLVGELTLHAAYLYPFAEKVLTPVAVWVAVYLANYADESALLAQFSSSAVAQVRDWLQRFTELTQRLSE